MVAFQGLKISPSWWRHSILWKWDLENWSGSNVEASFLRSSFLSIRKDCQSFPRHISRPKVCISHFLWFSVFSPYSRSFSVHFSFFTYFSDFVIFQVIKWMFLIFHDFHFSCHIPRSTVDRMCVFTHVETQGCCPESITCSSYSLRQGLSVKPRTYQYC